MRIPVSGGRFMDVLFHDALRDIFFAEKKILSTLPKLAKAANDDRLGEGIEEHRTWAEELELEGAVTLLQATLNEEEDTDRKLTESAEYVVYQEAEAA